LLILDLTGSTSSDRTRAYAALRRLPRRRWAHQRVRHFVPRQAKRIREDLQRRFAIAVLTGTWRVRLYSASHSFRSAWFLHVVHNHIAAIRTLKRILQAGPVVTFHSFPLGMPKAVSIRTRVMPLCPHGSPSHVGASNRSSKNFSQLRSTANQHSSRKLQVASNFDLLIFVSSRCTPHFSIGDQEPFTSRSS